MKHHFHHVLALIFTLPFSLLVNTNYAHCQTPDTLQAQFTVQQCDSLIQANANNPNFVILDVRTPGEYDPQHLEGAINRDYYASNFSQTINSLPKHKMYVIHCAGGGRSLQTFNLMKSFGFPQIVNMLGGISAWVSASFPTTSLFAPLLMGVSDSLVGIDTIAIGQVDTIRCTITNRANDTLRLTSISNLTSTEFWTDFDTSQYLLGASDYTFSIFYGPTDTIWDSLVFIIQSNGGMIDFHVTGTGVSTAGIPTIATGPGLKPYPNPFQDKVLIEWYMEQPGPVEISFWNQTGQLVDCIHLSTTSSGMNRVEWDSQDLPSGIYFVSVKSVGTVWDAILVKN